MFFEKRTQSSIKHRRLLLALLSCGLALLLLLRRPLRIPSSTARLPA